MNRNTRTRLQEIRRRIKRRLEGTRGDLGRPMFRTFVNALITIPCQILFTEQRLVYRVLHYNIHLPVFFPLCTAVRY